MTESVLIVGVGSGLSASLARLCYKKNMTVVPIIVTLYKEETSFVNHTPIVPIFQFSSFIDEFYGNLEYMNTIEK